MNVEELTDFEKEKLIKLAVVMEFADEVFNDLKQVNFLDQSSLREAETNLKQALMWAQRAVVNPDKPGRH